MPSKGIKFDYLVQVVENEEFAINKKILNTKNNTFINVFCNKIFSNYRSLQIF